MDECINGIDDSAEDSKLRYFSLAITKYIGTFLTGFLVRFAAPPVEGSNGGIWTFLQAIAGGFLATGLLRLPSPGGLKTPAIKGNTNKMANQVQITFSVEGYSFQPFDISISPAVGAVLSFLSAKGTPALSATFDIQQNGDEIIATPIIDGAALPAETLAIPALLADAIGAIKFVTKQTEVAITASAVLV